MVDTFDWSPRPHPGLSHDNLTTDLLRLPIVLKTWYRNFIRFRMWNGPSGWSSGVRVRKTQIYRDTCRDGDMKGVIYIYTSENTVKGMI